MPRSSTSRGITPTPHRQLTWSRRSSRMPSVFTTCWETYGSGWQIGMVRTLLQMPLTPRALESGGFEWGAEDPGTTAHRLPALRAAATTAAAAVPPATDSGAPPIESFSRWRCPPVASTLPSAAWPQTQHVTERPIAPKCVLTQALYSRVPESRASGKFPTRRAIANHTYSKTSFSWELQKDCRAFRICCSLPKLNLIEPLSELLHAQPVR